MRTLEAGMAALIPASLAAVGASVSTNPFNVIWQILVVAYSCCCCAMAVLASWLLVAVPVYVAKAADRVGARHRKPPLHPTVLGLCFPGVIAWIRDAVRGLPIRPVPASCRLSNAGKKGSSHSARMLCWLRDPQPSAYPGGLLYPACTTLNRTGSRWSGNKPQHGHVLYWNSRAR